MLKSLLFLAPFLFSGLLFGKHSHSTSKSESFLFAVKKILEAHLAGTNIRDLQAKFSIERKGSDGYIFVSDLNVMLPTNRIHLLQPELNRLPDADIGYPLTGIADFDLYLDSVLVCFNAYHPDNIHFKSVPNVAVPRGGLENFSKRLHDFLKEQIAMQVLSPDSLRRRKYIDFTVERDGTLYRKKQDDLKGVLNNFFRVEKKWIPGIMSARPYVRRVEFKLHHAYLLGSSAWPGNLRPSDAYGLQVGDWAPWADVFFMTPFEIGQEITFYSHSKKTDNLQNTVVSMHYDPMLKQYRMPCVHSGCVENSGRLIREILEATNQKPYVYDGYHGRIYFYRE